MLIKINIQSGSLDTDLSLYVLVLSPNGMVRSQIGKIMRKSGNPSLSHTLNVGIDNTHCSVITDKVLRGLHALPWSNGHGLMITPTVPI